jgi:hypothetical protein
MELLNYLKMEMIIQRSLNSALLLLSSKVGAGHARSLKQLART